MAPAPDHQDRPMKSEELIDLVTTEPTRSILAAGSNEPLSAQELAEACDVSESTIYRKAKVLKQHGFLDEDLQVDTSGSHQKVFKTTLDSLTLRFLEGSLETTFHLRRDFIDKFSALWQDLEQSGSEFFWRSS